jgi:hypothetical protein
MTPTSLLQLDKAVLDEIRGSRDLCWANVQQGSVTSDFYGIISLLVPKTRRNGKAASPSIKIVIPRKMLHGNQLDSSILTSFRETIRHAISILYSGNKGKTIFVTLPTRVDCCEDQHRIAEPELRQLNLTIAIRNSPVCACGNGKLIGTWICDGCWNAMSQTAKDAWLPLQFSNKLASNKEFLGVYRNTIRHLHKNMPSLCWQRLSIGGATVTTGGK